MERDPDEVRRSGEEGKRRELEGRGEMNQPFVSLPVHFWWHKVDVISPSLYLSQVSTPLPPHGILTAEMLLSRSPP